jgi:hypothetical protein
LLAPILKIAHFNHLPQKSEFKNPHFKNLKKLPTLMDTMLETNTH